MCEHRRAMRCAFIMLNNTRMWSCVLRASASAVFASPQTCSKMSLREWSTSSFKSR